MHREIQTWWSSALHKDMEIVSYGHYGRVLLMFPTAASDYLEYERFQVVDAMADLIERGLYKVFAINSINNESWLNEWMSPADKSRRHLQYNSYVINEVVPYIFNHCRGHVPIITTGASFGALHAANTFFRNPHLFAGTIALSGSYDLKDYTKGYFDDNVYFNSPKDYLQNLNDERILQQLRNNKTIVIATGGGDYEDPDASRSLSAILNEKHIKHWLDIWGEDVPHDWPAWRKMYPYFLSKI